MSEHTPGPLAARPDVIEPRWIVESEVHFVAVTLWNDESCARLLAAAYTSYDKHCGPRTIECAEGDLLGEALEACRDAFEKATSDTLARLDVFQIRKLEKVLNKIKETRNEEAI